MLNRVTRKLQSIAAYQITKRRIKHVSSLSETDLEEYLDLRWVKFARTAVQKVPFYRDHFREYGYRVEQIVDRSSLALFPVINKRIVQTNPDRFINGHYNREKLTVNSTSGSTGRKFSVWATASATAVERAYIHDAWSRVEYRPGKDLVLAIRSRPGYGSATTSDIAFDRRDRTYKCSVFQLYGKRLTEIIELLQKEQICYIHTYPSAGEYLVAAVKQTMGDPKKLFSSLRAFLISSETLRPETRDTISRDSGVRVFSHYGHAEHLILAPECEWDAAYHVYPDYGLIELIDDQGEQVSAAGCAGELTGTTLLNYAMPLIRYRTGDSAVLDKPLCKCARIGIRLSSVTGKFKTERVYDCEFSPLNLTFLMRAISHYEGATGFDRMLRFQFRQEVPGKVTLVYIPRGEFNEEHREELRRKFTHACLGSIELIFKEVTEIPSESSGKLKLLVQHLDQKMDQQ